jgi:hypothetical protein
VCQRLDLLGPVGQRVVDYVVAACRFGCSALGVCPRRADDGASEAWCQLCTTAPKRMELVGRA